MPPQLALFLCWIAIGWLLYQDHRRHPNCSRALWLPVLWMMLLGSRPLSFWVGYTGSGDSGDLEGNAFDRVFYTLMILASFAILHSRRFRWTTFFGGNRTLFLFYAFLLASIVWSAFPYVTFKRWFKEAGGLGPILIILTEEDPLEAIEVVFLRCAYVLLPLSVVFIKYFPDLGRSFSASFMPTYTGVTVQKNSLGEIVMVFGMMIIWSVARRWTGGTLRERARQLGWPGLVLLMGVWLLHMSDSKTAMICLLAGALILYSPRIPWLRASPKRTLFLFFVAAPLFYAADDTFHVMDPVLHMLGRNRTFTGRTGIWEVLKEHPVDPYFGCGYLNYWDMIGVVEINGYDTSLKTLHNGYLDIYADGGAMGMTVLFIMLLALGVRASRRLLHGGLLGRLQFAFFVITLLYNFSESTYARRCPLWFTFLLLSIGPDPERCVESREAQETYEAAEEEEYVPVVAESPRPGTVQ